MKMPLNNEGTIFYPQQGAELVCFGHVVRVIELRREEGRYVIKLLRPGIVPWVSLKGVLGEKPFNEAVKLSLNCLGETRC